MSSNINLVWRFRDLLSIGCIFSKPRLIKTLFRVREFGIELTSRDLREASIFGYPIYIVAG